MLFDSAFVDVLPDDKLDTLAVVFPSIASHFAIVAAVKNVESVSTATLLVTIELPLYVTSTTMI